MATKIAKAFAGLSAPKSVDFREVEHPGLCGIPLRKDDPMNPSSPGLYPRQAEFWELLYGRGAEKYYRQWPDELSPGQRAEDVIGGALYVGFGGSPGPGKSYALARAALNFALRFPGSVTVLGRHVRGSIASSTMEHMESGLEYCRTVYGLEVALPTGTNPEIRLGTHREESLCSTIRLIDTAGHDKWQGGNWDSVFFDEAVQVSDQAYYQAMQRLRGSVNRERLGAAWPRIAGWASNRGGGWPKRLFWKPYRAGCLDDPADMKHRRYFFVKATTYDNPAQGETYARQLIDARGDTRQVRAELDGEWDLDSELVYGEFDFHNMVRDFDPLALANRPAPDCVEFGAYDWGASHKAAGVVGFIAKAVVDDILAHRLYIWDCFSVRRETVFDHGARMRSYPDALWYCDQSIRSHKMHGHQSTIASQLEAMGIRLTAANEGALRRWVKPGIEIVKRALSLGLVVVHPRCMGWFDAMAEYHWEIGPDGEPDDSKPAKEKDDEADAFRYLLINVFPRLESLNRQDGLLSSPQAMAAWRGDEVALPEDWKDSPSMRGVFLENGVAAAQEKAEMEEALSGKRASHRAKRLDAAGRFGGWPVRRRI